MNNEFFLLGLALILMHEMDAIRCREWRIFPGLSSLDDRLGFRIFILAHIPIFYFVFREVLNGSASFRLGFDIFLIVHMMLHILFLWHKRNEFKDWVSWSIIAGAAICGAVDLIFIN